jgi:YidC/Oxa1 family membrane protein insertase
VPSANIFARKVGNDLFTAGVVVPLAGRAPGATSSIEVPLYAGPQIQNDLVELAPGLDLVVDYGWLTIIASPMHWVLEKIA